VLSEGHEAGDHSRARHGMEIVTLASGRSVRCNKTRRLDVQPRVHHTTSSRHGNIECQVVRYLFTLGKLCRSRSDELQMALLCDGPDEGYQIESDELT